MFVTAVMVTAMDPILMSITASDAAARKAKPLDLSTTLEINIDGSKEGRIFDGNGSLSAGASSRLLIDYAPWPGLGRLRQNA